MKRVQREGAEIAVRCHRPIAFSDVQLPEYLAIITEFNTIARDPRASVHEIADVIARSPSLAALLLKVANSAVFGFPSRIDTITRAITLLGTREVGALAMGITVMRYFQNIPDGLVDPTTFTLHSFARGILSRILAAHTRQPHTERMFASGLMQDIGRLVWYRYFPEQAKLVLEMAATTGISLYELENECLGISHEQIAAQLLRKWQLPDPLINAIAHHHRPCRSPAPVEPGIVHLADIAVNALESVEYLTLFKRHNAELMTKVDQKVEELRRRDLQLLNARKMDAVATLAGGVAHQFNNALAAFMGSLELIRLQIAQGKDIDNNLERLDAVARRMQELTAKLTAYARGGKHLTHRIFVDELVKKVLSGARKTFANPVDIAVVVPAGAHAVDVDATQMELALSAMIINALEALEEGGRIAISAKGMSLPDASRSTPLDIQPGNYVVLTIEDNGREMDAHAMEHIFDPFFSTKFTGRGLSMAAAYGVVKNHDGEITVTSEVGRGTTIRVYLPTVATLDGSGPAASDPLHFSSKTGRPFPF